MSGIDSDMFPRDGSRKRPKLQSGSRLYLAFMVFVLIATNVLNGWNATPSVFAASTKNPNATIPTPSWLQQTSSSAKVPNLNLTVQGKQDTTLKPIGHPQPKQPAPEMLTLTTLAKQFLSVDKHFALSIPAHAVSAPQLQAAGGSIKLQIVHLAGASGGASSGQIMFGSYQLNLIDATGQPLTTLELAQPITVSYQLTSDQVNGMGQGQIVYALWGAANTAAVTTTSPNAKSQSALSIGKPTTIDMKKPHTFKTQVDHSGRIYSWSSRLSQNTPTIASAITPATATAAVSSSTVTFSTQSPEASWGKPTDSQVGLNSGGLTYSYPFSLPAGPGGLTPPLTLSYASGSVNESHNVQATAPLVGEGWSLGLGSISWSQEDVTPDSTDRHENVWSINDPYGTSGQLIPPDFNAATEAPTTPAMDSLPAQYIWQTAPDSHARVQEINFNGQPCWHVWLQNGTLEEFGCTDEARQSAPDASGTLQPYRWDLNLIVDRYGNQIRVHYQRKWPSGIGIRDAVISSVEYDDPTCHNTTFTGATAGCVAWNPKIKLVFNATTIPDRLTNSDCSGWTDTNTRCDDPIDLSSSGGWAAPKATNVFVLNNVEVQVNSNVLHRYLFSYAQSHPTTITDPLSGLSISAKGYLDLTRIQEQGTAGTTLNAPIITMTYQAFTQHYEDLSQHAKSSNNCGPSWMHSDSNGCFLWSQSYNAHYLTLLDNGRGWHQTISWKEARSNVHGVDSGSINDVFTCDGQESSSNLCGQADDAAWSRIVVSQRSEVTNGVTSTWNYNYYLRTGWIAPPCANCNQGYMWGNINDEDYADYYNYSFTSFAYAQVINPDKSSATYYYASSNGIGVASNSITCYASVTCYAAPYSDPDPSIAGQVKEEQDYDTNGNLLSVSKYNYATNCPASGIGHSANAVGAPSDIGDTQLSSQLDRNNPVVVCDPHLNQEDDYRVDGVTDINSYTTDNRVLHTIVKNSYDTDNQGSSDSNGYAYGNISRIETTTNDTNNQVVINGTTYYPNDNIGSGVYLTNLPAYGFTQDSSGTKYNCTASVYGANANASQAPTVSGLTKSVAYLKNNNCSGSSTTLGHTYDASGTAITGTDADGHLGCTSGQNKYSTCATYDNSDTHLLSTMDAMNHPISYTYDSGVSGGYGQWLTTSTDPNSQVTSYQYDALGRLTAEFLPGDSSSSPSLSYTYINTCTNGSTTPCLEIDTTSRINVGSGNSTSVTKQYYDGMGRLVETIAPGAALLSKIPAIPSLDVSYTIYDAMGNAATKSKPYAIPDYSGTPGTNSYVAPDLTQPRTVTRYDGADRTLGTITYSNATAITSSLSITYVVAQGVPGMTVDTQTPFEIATTVDAYKHQTITYGDALGQIRYTQEYTGIGSTTRPYLPYQTVQTNYDIIGNATSTNTYDQNGTKVAYQTDVYDGENQLIGWNDADSGSCSNVPMPAGCSSSTDTAWKAVYDGNGNLLSQTDPRGQTVYASYDALDRLLCKGTTSASVNPCQSSAYAAYFYDSYNNSSNASLTFPSGCSAPTSSYAVGTTVAETFSNSVSSGWRCHGTDARGQDIMDTLSVTADNKTTTQSVSMAYNNGEDLKTLTYPDGEIVSYNNDDNGFFRGMTNAAGNIVSSVNYATFGSLSSMIVGGTVYKGTATTPVQLTLGYDTGDRQTSISASISGTSIYNQTRTYDNVGNVLQVSTTVPKTTGGSKVDAQSYCYDEQNRLVWAGNIGTPGGSDHCGLTPSGTTTPTYQQPFSYDAADRLTNGSAGTVGYDTNHVHAATTLSTIANQYASYDDMGDMTCRNVDTTNAHSCASGAQTGALMAYDAEGRLASWTAPGGTATSDQFLYDAEGQRVLQRTSTTTGSATNVTDVITFNGYTDTTITNGTTVDVTKYYTAQGITVAMTNSLGWFTLVPDVLGNTTLALNSNGSVKAVELYTPYGSVRYSDGVMPTAYNYTGQRLDSTTGLLYYNARYYDPISARFTSPDTVEANDSGFDPYAYTGNNPTTNTDPSGHCFIVCSIAVGFGLADVGEAIGAVAAAATSPAWIVPVLVGVAIGAAIIGGIYLYNKYHSQPAQTTTHASVSTTTTSPGIGFSVPSQPTSDGGGSNSGGGYGGSYGGGCTNCSGGYDWVSSPDIYNYTSQWATTSLPQPQVVLPPPPPPPPPVTWGTGTGGAILGGITSLASQASDDAKKNGIETTFTQYGRDVKVFITPQAYKEGFKKIREAGVAEFVEAIQKGLVAAKGSDGIKSLTNSVKKYEIKVRNYNWRFYGDFSKIEGRYIFDEFGEAKH